VWKRVGRGWMARILEVVKGVRWWRDEGVWVLL